MDDYEGSRAEFMKMLAEHDGPPAYILRAQRVEQAWESLIRKCQNDQRELLPVADRNGNLVGVMNRQEALDVLLGCGQRGIGLACSALLIAALAQKLLAFASQPCHLFF